MCVLEAAGAGLPYAYQVPGTRVPIPGLVPGLVWYPGSGFASSSLT